MSKPISPWSESAEVISPDGRYRAVIRDTGEIAMGGPTSGTLIISENRKGGRVYARVDSCSPPVVWAEDSGALAVAQWTHDRMQRLSIVSLPGGTVRGLPEEFSVLELHSFSEGIVRGVDSPIHRPRDLEISVKELIEREPE